jgi:signal transduction histidine kinase
VRSRLLLSYLTLTVFVLAVLEVPLALRYASQERQQLTARVERDAVALATFAGPNDTPAGRARMRSYATSYRARTGGRVLVVDRRGRPIVDSGPSEGAASYLSRPEIARALDGAVAYGTRFSRTLGHDLLYVAVPVASEGTVRGAVRITYPTSAVDARVHRYWLVLLGIACVVLVVALAIGIWFAESISRPLRALQIAARRAGEGDLAARAPTGGPPEVQAVATAFNDTAAKLEALLLAQREFVSDASHQLRSPLAALRLRLENLERDVTPAGRSELASAESEVGRLSRLVDGLLELARADRQPSAPGPLQLGSIVDERVGVWSPLAAEHGVALRWAHVPAEVLGTPGHVEQVLDNLLANALEASGPGTAITLTLERDAGFVELHVLDEGPGMTPDERGHAFARFWRVGSASGTGLGLAIVRRLAEADGGSAELREAPGGGIDAVVRLVAAPRTHGVAATAGRPNG